MQFTQNIVAEKLIIVFEKKSVYFCLPKKLGEVSEWLKELPWKGSMWATASRVRIPLSPHQKRLSVEKAFFIACV